jgi:aldehyde dehydrogenase (NAD+)
MGALVSPEQKARVETLVARGVLEGAALWQPDIALPKIGEFYPPTLLTEVAPANIVACEEIFGPVLTVMTFRTLNEAASLANNTRYGLAASIWSENINRALEAASQVKAGVVWINTTNEFDAASGFGGYRESGFGREGGVEGFGEYLKRTEDWDTGPAPVFDLPAGTGPAPSQAIDRTAKNFIGGVQTRPDGGHTRLILDAKGRGAGRAPDSDRKDIRDAVEAAAAAQGWSRAAPHARAQILYYIAETLSTREEEFAKQLAGLTGATRRDARSEVALSLSRLFSYAAWTDKFEGVVHQIAGRKTVIAVKEPLGVIGIVCPDAAPLLSFLSLLAPAIAMGNRAVIVPSARWPLIATELALVFQSSDVPPGVINIVAGGRDKLAETLAAHDGVDAIWYHGTAEGSALVERLSAGNLKRSWVNGGRPRNWRAASTGEGRQFLHEATQVKNIWLPYGE